MRYVNVSAIESFQRCQRLWYHKYVLRRGYAEESKALVDGITWHRLMEQVAAGGEAYVTTPWMQQGLLEWIAWRNENNIEILATELELRRLLLPDVTLVGRLDALVRWNGRLWHLQHKTLAASAPVPVYQVLAARAHHEHAYRFLLEPHEPVYGGAYAGVLLAVCRKLSAAAIARGEHVMHVAFVPLAGDHAERMRELEALVRVMQLVHEPPLVHGPPPQNPSACGGAYRNRLCEYIDVCNGRLSPDVLPEAFPFEGYSVEGRRLLCGEEKP